LACKISKNAYFCWREQKEIVQMGVHEEFLRAILSTVARQTFPPARLLEMVAPTSRSEKQVAAFNLCDGTHNPKSRRQLGWTRAT
jgi:hypothetical protein